MKVACAFLAFALLASQVNAQGGAGQPSQGPPPPPPPPPPPSPSVVPPTQPPAQPPAQPPRPVVPPTQPPVVPPTVGPTPGPTPRPPLPPNVTTVTTVPGATPTAAGTVAGGPTEADILYFAYQLEVFEAQFYTCAATGTGISADLLGGGPAPVGCQRAALTSNVGTYAAELAREETAHVALLQNALRQAGANPIAPAIDISVTPFNAAAQVATGNNNLQPQFNPYANDFFFLHAAFLFEDLGVSAYLGALNSIGTPAYRLTAAQIGAAEAYHAALARTLLFQVIDQVPAYNLTVAQITSAITNTVNTIAGQPQIKYSLQNQQGASISNVDSNGLVPGASAQQVTRVVTLGAPNGSGGGFFPANFNGNVKN